MNRQLDKCHVHLFQSIFRNRSCAPNYSAYSALIEVNDHAHAARVCAESAIPPSAPAPRVLISMAQC